ncbi:hypothetical protein [Pontibacter sp. G13]|uniref:hypothetical protein n=1 Tax=Pontibacter sp. G13 TaxID=3074898 RepID=UPI00288BD3AB|nr:hypothetical protein [Pontibacter sp. G13]WNJ17975.1 hypothetical protein RJD25_24230 [Pontibacter sp. G13]
MYGAQIQRIDKETLPEINFIYEEVLSDPAEIDRRSRKLQHAQRLGNEFKGKVSIVFMTDQGPVEVHTTIWQVGRRHVTLKYGHHIPIGAILSIQGVGTPNA